MTSNLFLVREIAGLNKYPDDTLDFVCKELDIPIINQKEVNTNGSSKSNEVIGVKTY